MLITLYALIREQVLKQSHRLKGLDSTTQEVFHAIIQQKDVFQAAHNAQIALTEARHKEAVSSIQHEHAITRREIIQEIRVRLPSSLFTTLLNRCSNPSRT